MNKKFSSVRVNFTIKMSGICIENKKIPIIKALLDTKFFQNFTRSDITYEPNHYIH